MKKSINLLDSIGHLIDDIINQCGVGRREAVGLLAVALDRSLVFNEIMNMVEYLKIGGNFPLPGRTPAVDRQRSINPSLLSLRDHILAMADDAYLVGHPEWIEIVNEAQAVIVEMEGVK